MPYGTGLPGPGLPRPSIGFGEIRGLRRHLRLGQVRDWMPRAAALASLAVVFGLIALMVAVIVDSIRQNASGTVPIALGYWADNAIPVRAPLPLSEALGLWLLRGDVLPVDVKKGRPPDNADRAWEPERVQLCAAGLILRVPDGQQV